MSSVVSVQNQDVVPISSYDTAGSFLILGCNNGSIYYIGKELRSDCVLTLCFCRVVSEHFTWNSETFMAGDPGFSNVSTLSAWSGT